MSPPTLDAGNDKVKLNWYQFTNMERRHRIFPDEMPSFVNVIAEAIESKPLDDLKQGEGQALFRVLWRIKEHRSGPPSYPEVNENVVSQLLEIRQKYDTEKVKT